MTEKGAMPPRYRFGVSEFTDSVLVNRQDQADLDWWIIRPVNHASMQANRNINPLLSARWCFK